MSNSTQSRQPSQHPATPPTESMLASQQQRVGIGFYVALIACYLGLYTLYGGMLQIVLPQQATAIAGDGKVGVLSLVSTIGAVCALISQPLGGRGADRTKTRLGRRNVWIVGSAIFAAVAVICLGFTTTTLLLVIAWCFVQIITNFMQASLAAMLPERVPASTRGRISGFIGIMATGGNFVGAFVVNLAPSLAVGATYLAVILVIVAVILGVTNYRTGGARIDKRAMEAAELARAERNDKSGFRSFAASLPHFADYWWVFGGRFVILLSYHTVHNYLLFICTDYLKLDSTGIAPAEGVVILNGIATIGVVVTALGGGWLADRIGRIKPFIVIAAIAFALPVAILIVSPTWTAAIVAEILIGLAFGLFYAVDQALMARIVEGRPTAGQDIGLLNASGATAQVVSTLVAGAFVTFLGGYVGLFIGALVFALLGAAAVLPIKRVR